MSIESLTAAIKAAQASSAELAASLASTAIMFDGYNESIQRLHHMKLTNDAITAINTHGIGKALMAIHRRGSPAAWEWVEEIGSEAAHEAVDAIYGLSMDAWEIAAGQLDLSVETADNAFDIITDVEIAARPDPEQEWEDEYLDRFGY